MHQSGKNKVKIYEKNTKSYVRDYLDLLWNESPYLLWILITSILQSFCKRINKLVLIGWLFFGW